MQPSKTSPRRKAALLATVAVGGALSTVGVQAAFSKPSVAAPTLTSTPATATSATSATFAFTGPNGATFRCSRDGAAFAACTSPTAYSGLTEARHTFAVKAVSGTTESDPTTYAWTVDSTPPPAPVLSSEPAAVSTSTNPSFVFTDSESGVTFTCALDGSAMLPCANPKVYSGLGQGSHSFTLRAVDAAGNASPVTTYAWSIDSVAPAAATLTTKPSNPTPNATNYFAWTVGESGLTAQCSLENGAWAACSSPYTWVIGTTNYGQHQLAVRLLDAAGNISASTAYAFKYEKGQPTSGMPFTISGQVSGLVLGVWKPIAVRVSNPNPVTIYVNALSVGLPADSTPAGCPSAANLELEQSDVSATHLLAVPPNGFVDLPSGGVSAPRIRLKNLPTVNQNACKGVSFGLTYTGTATN